MQQGTDALAHSSDDRGIELASVANLRDLGGLPAAGGTVARGRVFRSASLAELSPEDGAELAARGIALAVDFRTAAETSAAPDRLPAEIAPLALDVLADSPGAGAANIPALLAAPAQFLALVSGGGIAEALRDSYREIVSLPSARAAYREFFLRLGDSAAPGAVIFHCTTGKDRTGWGAASLLALLGAPDEAIRADYLRTNTDLLPRLAPLFARAEEAGVDPDLLRPLLGVQEDYLDTAFAQVRSEYGDMDGYFERALGLSAVERDAVRERFLSA